LERTQEKGRLNYTRDLGRRGKRGFIWGIKIKMREDKRVRERKSEGR
jgi:hypothetical protein